MPMPPSPTLASASFGSPGGRAWHDTVQPDDGETWGDRLLAMANTLVHAPVLPGRERPRAGTPSLASAVAAIVGIAAQRAQAAGELGNLRALIERALDAVEQPAEDTQEGAGLPCIGDMDADQEQTRLLSLMQRQSRR